MKMAIHQPNYLPWVGYFFKIFLADTFVFLDDIVFSNRSYVKRCHIRKELFQVERTYLSVPVLQGKKGKRLNTVLIQEDDEWKWKHLRKISYIYSKCDFYDVYYHDLAAEILGYSSRSLVELNRRLIRWTSRQLDLNTTFRMSSAFNLAGLSHPEDRNMALCQKMGASTYIAGAGAKNYESPASYAKNHLSYVAVDSFEYLSKQPYEQQGLSFINGLSIIDALFNIGAEGINDLFQRHAEALQLS